MAITTARDVLRRPGGTVALLITGSLLVLLPRMARRALDDGSALGSELILTTLALHAALLAGLTAVQAGSTGSALGPVPEFLSTPLRWHEYVAARMLGILSSAAAHVGALAAVAAVAVLLTSDATVLTPSFVAGAASSLALQTLLFAAAGLCAGALGGAELGSIALVALIVAARVVIPNLTDGGSPWSWVVLDPARMDVAREIALGRPLGASAWASMWFATLLQTAGLLCAAYAGLSSRGLRRGRAAV